MPKHEDPKSPANIVQHTRDFELHGSAGQPVRGNQSSQIIGDPISNLDSIHTLGELANSLLVTRRKIDEIFEHEGFAVSPACDIVLVLFYAQANGTECTVNEVCRAAAYTSSSAVRWIRALEAMQLIELVDDGSDIGEATIRLTQIGFHKSAEALRLHL